jgi:hypothetical protein
LDLRVVVYAGEKLLEKVPRLPRKNEAEASEVLHLSIDGYATKVTTVSRNKSFENLKTAVKFTTWDKSPLAAPLILTHACQRFGNVHEMLRARATRMSKCPMSCACHTKRGSDPPKVPNLFAPATKIAHSSNKQTLQHTARRRERTSAREV